MPRVLSILVLWCCLLAGPAYALDPGKSFHHYVHDTWSVPEGMPQISAVAIAQTPDGYIWVGTQAGLARFDGVGFTAFSPANEPALPHPIVTALALGGDGALWIGTRSGMAVLRESGFHPVPWAGADGAPRISGLHLAGDGRVWAATSSGAAYVQDGALRPVADGGGVTALAVTGDGTLWIAGLDGVRRRDGNAWTATTWPGGQAPLVGDLLEVGDEIWAATSRGFYIHDPSGWRPVAGTTGPDALPLRFVYRDDEGNVWGGGDLGLVRVRPDRTVETVRATRGNGLFNLFSAFQDREGNLWLGSLSNGLSRVWNGWTRRYSVEEGLPDATVWALAPEAGGDGIWVGTNNGLAFLDDDGRFTVPATTAAAAGAVHALLVEPGRVWFGLRSGLALYEPGRGAPATVPEWSRAIRSAVFGVSRDDQGHLWIGTRDALLRWDGTRLERFDATRELGGPLVEFRLVALEDGRRLVVTQGGLFEFDGNAFRPAPEGLDLPDDIRLNSLAELDDGRLLVASVDALLLLRHQDRWHRVGEAAGLLPGVPFQIIERDGLLWVSSMQGVYRLKLEDLTAFAEGRIASINPEILLNERGMPNGGQQGVCCNGAGHTDGFIAGETLWLPTRDGVLALDTSAVHYNRQPPRVHLGRVRVGEHWRALPPDATTVLAADERDLTLAFDLLSYQDPRSNHARYRLAGYDQDWQTATPMTRQVRYTNLPPGEYVFEVLGSNNADVWTPLPARLRFTIRPHFHETAGFRLLLAALVLLLMYAGYRYQRYRYRVSRQRLETLVSERTAALAESNRQLEQASLTDPLTGLRNRRYLARQVPADLDYYDRLLANPATNDVVVFAMLDLDHFKQVNDLHGHAAGDRVLEQVALRLQALVRSGDYLVRWGGEEFLLLFRPMPAAQVPMLGERLHRAVSTMPFDIGNEGRIDLTASIGLSEYPMFRDSGRPLGWEAMVELADQALYYVKRNGRGGWAMFRPTATTRTDTLLADLQRDPAALLREGALKLVGSVTDDVGNG